MFERFTAEARAVVVQAQEIARELRHNYIGCEHLLLGLLRETESVPGHALASAGVGFDAMRDRVLHHSPSGEGESPSQMPFTPRAKKALELALREAKRLGARHIAAEHILLGVLRTDDNLACNVLIELGVDLDALREAVVEAIPAPEPVHMHARVRRLVGDRPVAGPVPASDRGFHVEQSEEVQRLLMSAAARALDDGRTRIEIADVAEALRRRPPSAAAG